MNNAFDTVNIILDDLKCGKIKLREEKCGFHAIKDILKKKGE